MAIEASDDVAGFFKFLVGEDFPAANEDRIFGLAQAYEHAANGLDESAPLLQAGINSVRDAVSGKAEQAFVASMEEYTSASPGYLTVAAKYIHRLGHDHRDLGTQVQYAKLMIIVAIVELIIEFLVAVALSFWNPFAVPEFLAAAYELMEQFLGKLVTRIAVQVAISQITGIAMQVLMDFIVQRLQMDVFHTRDHWDWSLTKGAIAIGSLGSAIGLGLHGLGHLASKGLGGAGHRVGVPTPKEKPPVDAPVPEPSFGKKAADFAKDAAHEAAVEDLTERVYNVTQGQDFWSSTGWGAAWSGVMSHAAQTAGGALGARLRGPRPPNGHSPNEAHPLVIQESGANSEPLPPYSPPPPEYSATAPAPLENAPVAPTPLPPPPGPSATPAPATTPPAPVTPAPVTPALATPSSTTPAPVTPVPPVTEAGAWASGSGPARPAPVTELGAWASGSGPAGPAPVQLATGPAQAADPPVGTPGAGGVSMSTVVHQVTETIGVGTDQANSVALLGGLKDQFYPDGVRQSGSQGDLASGSRQVEQNLVPGPGWSGVSSWQDLHDAVRQTGPGSTAFVLFGRQSGMGHGIALHHGLDGTIVRLDVQAAPGRQIVAGLDGLEAPTAVRAVVLDGTGRVIDGALAPVVESTSTARAIVDAPTDPLTEVATVLQSGSRDGLLDGDLGGGPLEVPSRPVVAPEHPPLRVSGDSATPSPDEAQSIRAIAVPIARWAVWRHHNGLPMPTVEVAGHEDRGSGFLTRRTASRRAEEVERLLRGEVAAELNRLQGGPGPVRATDITISPVARGARPPSRLPGGGQDPADRGGTVDITVTYPRPPWIPAGLGPAGRGGSQQASSSTAPAASGPTASSGAGIQLGLASSLDTAENLPLVNELVPSADGTWSADGAQVLWRRLPEARDGWALLSDDQLAQLAGRPLLGPGDSVPVLVHPAGELVRVPVRGADGEVHWVRLTEEQLARMLADQLPEDATVALLSCAAGALPDGFAYRFAVESHRDVLAPQTDLFISLDGSAAQLMTVDGDSWLLFTADGSMWDTVNEDIDGQAHPIDGFTADDPSMVRPPDADGGFTLGRDGYAAPSRTARLKEIDDAAADFTEPYGYGQLGRATDYFRLRFSRDMQAQRAAQTLSHLSFDLHDTIRQLRDEAARYDPNVPVDLEVQGMLINNRLVFATNFNRSVELLRHAHATLHNQPGRPLQRLLAIQHADRTRGLHGVEAVEHRGRMERAHTKVDAAFAGARNNPTSHALLSGQGNLVFSDAGPQDAAALHHYLTNPWYEGSVILLQHADSMGHSMHAEQKLLLAVHSAGLRPHEVQGPHLVVGKYRPCLGCWAALTHYHASGFPVHFNPNYGHYYRESARSLVWHLPHTLVDPGGLPGNFIARTIAAQADSPMSVAALSDQRIPPNAYENNGREVLIPAAQASARGYVTASDSETEEHAQGVVRRYVSRKRVLHLDVENANTRRLGQPHAGTGRPAIRILREQDREQLSRAWRSNDTAAFTQLVKDYAARGATNEEMAGAVGTSATTVGRYKNDKTGHEARDARNRSEAAGGAVPTRVPTRRTIRRGDGRDDPVRPDKRPGKFTKHPDLDEAGKQRLVDAMSKESWRAWQERKAAPEGKRRKIPEPGADPRLDRTLNELAQRYNAQSIGDFLHVPGRTMRRRLHGDGGPEPAGAGGSQRAGQGAGDRTARHPGWTVGPDGALQWYGAGAPVSLPPNLQLGQASGVANRCLIDSLGQLIRAHSDNTMDTDELAEFLLENLPVDSEAYQALVAGEMIDVYDPALADLLIDSFGLRLQVFQVTGPPPHVVPHPVRGDEGPILYLLHQHLHFTPLWPNHPS